MSPPALFSPIQVGRMTLSHRVVLSPMTRLRLDPATSAVRTPLVPEFYAQRAKIPGSLLIAEANVISEKAGGLPLAPGIYTDVQIAAWKEVTDAVHAQGSFIFLQIAAAGRQALPHLISDVVAPSAIAKDTESPTPRALTVEEIEEYVEMFGIAAENAVLKAGFDGVEVHGASEFLVDQFTQDSSNQREDLYGGSPERRAKFTVDVIGRIAKTLGAERVGLKISTWQKEYGMRMANPVPTYSHLARELKRLYPAMAWLHVSESRIGITFTAEPAYEQQVVKEESNDYLRDIWAPLTYISTGGHSRDSGIKTAEEKGGLVAYGRWYLANPDLPKRIRDNLPFNVYNRATFYVPGGAVPDGYTDYPFVST